MLTILGVLALGVAGTALAQPGPVHYIHAPVIEVRPIQATERVPVEREVCWQARERTRPKSATGTIAGAIIGGVIGNQFGDGNGRRALTAAGAALGASIGHDASRRPGYRVVDRCEIQVDYETRSYTAGFDVHYEYNGEIFVTRTRHHPGDSIRLEIAARPAE
jgi:uncharacterized protein YcfJ